MSSYSVTTPARRNGSRYASVAGGSLLAPGRTAFTHQVLRRGGPNAVTSVEMFENDEGLLHSSNMFDESFHRSDISGHKKNLNSSNKKLQVIRDETLITTERSEAEDFG